MSDDRKIVETITVGAGTFRPGVKLSTVLARIERGFVWAAAAEKKFAQIQSSPLADDGERSTFTCIRCGEPFEATVLQFLCHPCFKEFQEEQSARSATGSQS